MTKFTDLGLKPDLLSAITKAGYDTPTPIQQKAIPLVLEGRDLIGLAQTGTGKTAAFGLPLIDRLMGAGAKPTPKSVRALILAPTRELVNQIAANLTAYTKDTPIRVVTVVGGQSLNNQVKKLERGTHILVATPGRLIDLCDRRAVFLDTVTYLVLDEADQMLDMGFIHALRKIAAKLAKPRQTLLFSATMPAQMEELSRAYLTDPARVQVSPPGKAADKITQALHYVPQGDKTELLKDYLNKDPDGLSLVFARTKHGAEKLKKNLEASGFKATSIHGNKSQNQRDRAIRDFKAGEARILVATDVAARGIDIPGVSHVYNYDLPEVAENYVHRIGRTARAGAEGEAIAFCSATEIGYLRQIEKVMKLTIPVVGGERPIEQKPEKRGGRGGGGGGNRGGGQRRSQPKPANQSHGKPKRNNRRRRKPAA
ncbi:DEAD/DEAH box helicase [Aliiroseovarius sp. YM-037]|uniref:DEAD/DEAH box helicase n=1 Tax=Aliiroseovarius sp. YM-037 TaxID=3341728 RepID=UPI003A809F34